MKKRYLLITILLLSFIVTNSSISFAEYSNLEVPPMLKDLKGKNELVGYFNDIKRVRSNISTIDINTITAKKKSEEIKKQINFYLTEMSTLQNSLSNFEKQYTDSQSDLIFSEQLRLLLNSYIMRLTQQLVLLDELLNNDLDATKLFYSDYLIYIYYYLNLGDQMVSYINTFYNLQ